MSAAHPWRTWRPAVKIYWAAWSALTALAVAFDIRPLLVPLIAAFAAGEAPALRSKLDRWPALTEMIGHYVPGWASFPALGLMCWRLWGWLPDPPVVALAWWLIWHFIKTYQDQ